jgi:hypothetical protein
MIVFFPLLVRFAKYCAHIFNKYVDIDIRGSVYTNNDCLKLYEFYYAGLRVLFLI